MDRIERMEGTPRMDAAPLLVTIQRDKQLTSHKHRFPTHVNPRQNPHIHTLHRLIELAYHEFVDDLLLRWRMAQYSYCGDMFSVLLP